MQSSCFEAPIIIGCVTSCAINVNLHIPNLHISIVWCETDVQLFDVSFLNHPTQDSGVFVK